jgi:hypothetical protein
MALALHRRDPATDQPPPSGRRSRTANLPARLGAKWRALKDLRLAVGDEFTALDLVILHPEHGIALVVVGRDFSLPDLAIRVVRTALREDGFGVRFPGFLPVVFLDVTEKEFPALPSLLTEAFRREATLELRDAGWTDAALDAIGRRSLDDAPMMWEAAVDEEEPEDPAPTPVQRRRGRTALVLTLGAAAFIVSGATTAVIGALSGPIGPAPAPQAQQVAVIPAAMPAHHVAVVPAAIPAEEVAVIPAPIPAEEVAVTPAALPAAGSADAAVPLFAGAAVPVVPSTRAVDLHAGTGRAIPIPNAKPARVRQVAAEESADRPEPVRPEHPARPSVILQKGHAFWSAPANLQIQPAQGADR